ncbi:DUF1614 domain-containing protein [Azospira restricta]|uniref:DUF1614 domain-containing protein n=1 Tax=Azospira restricta TaxID=404405 RepID=A0A974SPC6_9RHOO|nr:DUF1614 domain-containing protein [Azospira restricta]QRJ63973.1 DUF1614 domain-containing protein [Azospira restricta]
MPPLRLLLIFALVLVLLAVVQLGALSIAFDKLGLSPQRAGLLLAVSLLGSLVDLPLFALAGDPGAPPFVDDDGREHRPAERTVVAVNVGGCVVPVAFSAYLFALSPVPPAQVAFAVALMTMFSYSVSALLPGVGVVTPVLVVPIAAAFAGALLDPENRAVLAYIGGTLGVLIGADLMRLKELRGLGEPRVSIGGAGSFDGIFITGILAVLIA